jgi:hypothetical protein
VAADYEETMIDPTTTDVSLPTVAAGEVVA